MGKRKSKKRSLTPEDCASLIHDMEKASKYLADLPENKEWLLDEIEEIANLCDAAKKLAHEASTTYEIFDGRQK